MVSQTSHCAGSVGLAENGTYRHLQETPIDCNYGDEVVFLRLSEHKRS